MSGMVHSRTDCCTLTTLVLHTVQRPLLVSGTQTQVLAYGNIKCCGTIMQHQCCTWTATQMGFRLHCCCP